MSPDKLHALQTSDFRPIANIRLFYKVFAYRFYIASTISWNSNSVKLPSRKKNGKAFGNNKHPFGHGDRGWNTIWIVSLDLSKAFDRVHWPALWVALHDQGGSEHCIWLLQIQFGRSWEKSGRRRSFTIAAGVKQRRVLRPKFFSATLEWARRGWKDPSHGAGIDLRDGLPNVMEPRFAHDILLFANSGPEAAQLLGKLVVVAVGRNGWIPNVHETVLVTNQAQPQATLVIRDVVVKVLHRNRQQKGLGRMLTAAGSMKQGGDLFLPQRPKRKMFPRQPLDIAKSENFSGFEA